MYEIEIIIAKYCKPIERKCQINFIKLLFADKCMESFATMQPMVQESYTKGRKVKPNACQVYIPNTLFDQDNLGNLRKYKKKLENNGKIRKVMNSQESYPKS